MHSRFPNLGVWQRDWEPPALTLEARGIWLQDFHRTGETDSWRAQTKPCVHQDPGERSSVPTRYWARCACLCPGVSGGGVGQQWPAVGSGALNTTVSSGHKFFWKRSQTLICTIWITWKFCWNADSDSTDLQEGSRVYILNKLPCYSHGPGP